jgi:hypothetical protein
LPERSLDLRHVLRRLLLRFILLFQFPHHIANVE